MDFSNKLNEYMLLCSCTAKELSQASGISQSTISRYKSGERTPNTESKNLVSLAQGLALLSANNKKEIKSEDILSDLKQALGGENIDTKTLIDKLNALMNLFEIKNNTLAKAINYDPSHLSRIRSHSRNIAMPYDFANKVSEYIVRRYNSAEEIAALKKLTGDENTNLSDALLKYLCSGNIQRDNSISKFLYTLENFNLDEYIDSIHFNDIKVPTLPFSLPTSKNFYGTERMRRGELEFLKATILSRSKETVFMCSDMPITDMAKDLDFDKKWMMSLAVMLKKDLKINIIHNIDRPWNEMMLGLEAWIPIYMTGQVHPFYFKNIKTNIYHHINYVSGAAALSGECVDSFHKNGKYYLTNNKEEIKYYRQKSEDLLKKAHPLMDIYTEDMQNEFSAFLESEKANEYYVQEQAQKAFKNIEIKICPKKWALISKKSHPHIHFVIRHPRLMQAIENFSAEIEE